MKVVYLLGTTVREIVPFSLEQIPSLYGKQFSQSCIEAPDQVQPNWKYNPITGAFSEPVDEDEPSLESLQAENKLLKAQLQAQSDRSDFIEDCIAEMAIQVYGGV